MQEWNEFLHEHEYNLIQFSTILGCQIYIPNLPRGLSINNHMVYVGYKSFSYVEGKLKALAFELLRILGISSLHFDTKFTYSGRLSTIRGNMSAAVAK